MTVNIRQTRRASLNQATEALPPRPPSFQRRERRQSGPEEALRLWTRLLERWHSGGEIVEPGHKSGMPRAPLALVAEIKIAQRTGKRQVPVVGRRFPSRRRLLKIIDGAVDLALLARLPGCMPLVLRPEPPLVHQQQRGIEDAVAERAQRQRLDALHAAFGKQHGCGRQAVQIFADDVAIV